MGLPSTALSRATRLINELSPSTRGEQQWLTDEVRKMLAQLRGDLVVEAKRVLGEDVSAVESAVPDTARHSYEWALVHIDRVLKGGRDALAESTVPVGSPADPKVTKKVAGK